MTCACPGSYLYGDLYLDFLSRVGNSYFTALKKDPHQSNLLDRSQWVHLIFVKRPDERTGWGWVGRVVGWEEMSGYPLIAGDAREPSRDRISVKTYFCSFNEPCYQAVNRVFGPNKRSLSKFLNLFATFDDACLMWLDRATPLNHYETKHDWGRYRSAIYLKSKD